MRIVILFLLALLTVYAGPCVQGTVADLQALGSTGCTMHDGDVAVSDVSFSAFLNGMMIDSTTIDVAYYDWNTGGLDARFIAFVVFNCATYDEQVFCPQGIAMDSFTLRITISAPWRGDVGISRSGFPWALYQAPVDVGPITLTRTQALPTDYAGAIYVYRGGEAIPEPASFALIGTGLAALCLRRMR